MKKQITIKVIKEQEGMSKSGKPYVRLSILGEDGVWYSDFSNQHNQYWRKGDTIDVEVETNGKFSNIVWPSRANNWGRGEKHDSQSYGAPAPAPVDTRQTGYQRPVEQDTSSNTPGRNFGIIIERLDRIAAQIKTLNDVVMGIISNPVKKDSSFSKEEEFNRKASEVPSFEESDDLPF